MGVAAAKQVPQLEKVFPPTPPASDRDDYSRAASGAGSPVDSGRLIRFSTPPPSVTPTETLEIDRDTPDAHVPRDPRLIRLTGVHPFNVEAPLTDLFNAGFLTPPELHFVRNHGAVPEVHDDDIPDWEVTIEGMVENPITLTFAQISSWEHFAQHTLPVTLVCAGNRRKEQNVVRKSQGFSWGPAGTSTSLWTGPMLADVLAAARPDRRRARYVWFEGADQLPNGPYGTGVRLSWAMDRTRGMMLAYKMNGVSLPPDHGRPIRALIPGMIGGRSVKWLKKIIVSDRPSENYYHYYDNKVLPTYLTPQVIGTEEGKKFWLEEKYCIYDLNVNSAIAAPAHDEVLKVTSQETQNAYTIKGYAYGGGGRRIQRVEISLDKGTTWRLASITYPEDAYRAYNISENTMLFGGKLDMTWRDTCFCWCFWSISVPYTDILSSEVSDIVVRAMDESLNIQPRDMYWNILGMMNNPWFRVALHKEKAADGSVNVRFEHPTQPAMMKGGWMERVKSEGGDLAGVNWGERASDDSQTSGSETTTKKAAGVKMTNDSVTRVIEFEEFRSHAAKEDGAWFVVEGEVYDGSSFFNSHPGGAQSIIAVGGTDCTEEFQEIHSDTAKMQMPTYHIGTLSAEARAALKLVKESSTTDTSSEPRPTFLSPKDWLPTKLVEKTIVSHDSITLKFALEHSQQLLGLPVGQHIMVRLTPAAHGKPVLRAYTPVAHEEGSFTLLVKVYRDEGVEGRRGGIMSQALDALVTGESSIDVKGPIGKFTYIPASVRSGEHNVEFCGAPRKISKFLMICGGTGITPIYQVLESVASKADEGSGVRCFVAYGNRNADDMLCREELDMVLGQAGEQVKIVHSLSGSGAEAGVTAGGAEIRKGRVGVNLVEEGYRWLCEGSGKEDRDMMVLVCGPEGMEGSVRGWMRDRGGEWGLDYLGLLGLGDGSGQGIPKWILQD
ncbi:hypothetical protein BDZ91DRAFT_840974 [Kalaharituber pfeilii]|nr:hypothetical protein BDZ91DRAFT_840974 [Kalaharituber pfeilii]